MYHYFYVLKNNTIARRDVKKYVFEEYNKNTNEWEENDELFGICSGDVQVLFLDESKAERMIKRWQSK